PGVRAPARAWPDGTAASPRRAESQGGHTGRLWFVPQSCAIRQPCHTERMERSLLLDVYATYHKSGQIVLRAVAGTGISAEDFAFVSIVGPREPVTPTEISREFGLSLSTVLFRTGRSVELGFVERV